MSQKIKPLLSIGIIFRDDIRSIERCLKALQPLREAIPCEVVMADTGSVDGSRTVAERYADILFDFPWVDDFSAARNAVMDRASGKWYLTVDTDEYLDTDISELVDYLHRGVKPVGMVVQRNYFTYGMDGKYSDCWAGRLVRMSSGLRYQRRIHEIFSVADEQCAMLAETVLHHDGYVELNNGKGGSKRARNVALLRKSLAEDPENLQLYMQYIESGREEGDWLEHVRRAGALVEAKKPGWRECGPPIFRHAVSAARQLELPEVEAWINRAEEWFPDSYFTRIDVAHFAFFESWERENWGDCIRRGESFLQAKADYRAGGKKQAGLMYSTLSTASPQWEVGLRILLVIAYMKEGQAERAWMMLESLDGTEMDAAQAGNLALALLEFQAGSTQETGLLLLRLYDELCQPKPSAECAEERRNKFLALAAAGFDPTFRHRESAQKNFVRPSYTLLRPLADRCELGIAAVVMDSADTGEIERLLRTVEHWDRLPAAALEHALSEGVVFPMPGKPLALEEMDILASRMAREDNNMLIRLAVRLAEHLPEDWQGLIWARELTLAAVQSCDWGEAEQSMNLCRAFARIEGAVLPRYYGEALLCEENICVLPPMHRFGWYCAQAFEAMDSGSHTEYARLLRAGLTSCPSMKAMAEFLMRELERTMRPQATPELLSLAEQVRTLLAAYDPDDPAVKALKASPAYQKVAHLIEGPDLGVWGGLPQ